MNQFMSNLVCEGFSSCTTTYCNEKAEMQKRKFDDVTRQYSTGWNWVILVQYNAMVLSILKCSSIRDFLPSQLLDMKLMLLFSHLVWMYATYTLKCVGNLRFKSELLQIKLWLYV